MKEIFLIVTENALANSIKNYLKDHLNLKHLGFKVGKYNMDFGDENMIPFCGVFESKHNLEYFEDSITKK